MATAHSVAHPYQVALVCGLCGDSQDVLWYCGTCSGDLCTTCKDQHTEKQIFKRHKILSRQEALTQRYSEQCPLHPENVFIMYCNTSKTFVCSKCLSVSHRGHDLSEIQTVMESTQQNFLELSNKLESNLKPQCEKEKNDVYVNISMCKDWYTAIEEDMTHRGTYLKGEIDRVCDEILQKASEERDKNISEMQNTFHAIKSKEDEIDALAKEMNEVLQKCNTDQINFLNEKANSFDFNIPQVKPLQLPNLQQTDPNIEELVEQIGTLRFEEPDAGEEIVGVGFTLIDNLVAASDFEDTALKLPIATNDAQILTADPSAASIKTEIVFRRESVQRVDNIVTVSDDEAWVSKFFKGEIDCISTGSTTIKTMKTNFQMYDFVVTTDDIIATDFWGQYIQKMSKDCKESIPVVRTDPLCPSGICLSNDNQNIAVCMYNTHDYRSTLVVYSLDFFLNVQTIAYTDKIVSDWYPKQRVTQNKNGDYCIVHCDLKTLFVVDSSGDAKFTYEGAAVGATENRFEPMDVCCDSNNHILISDTGNHSIHMLDHHGNFIRYLLNELDGIQSPVGLCIDTEKRLWVGYGEKSLCIVKYLS